MATTENGTIPTAPASTSAGQGVRTPEELLPIKLVSVTVGAVSLVATLVAAYFFLRMRRSFRHDLILLLFLGDFIKGACFITYPIASFANRLNEIPRGSVFCEINGYFLTFGTEASDIAVLIIALHTVLNTVRIRRMGGDAGLYPYRYAAYSFFLLYPLINAALAFVNGPPGFADSGEFCYLPLREAWYRSYLAWTPRYIIFCLIVALYSFLVVYVRCSQWQYEHTDFRRPSVSPRTSVTPPAPPQVAHQHPRLQRHSLVPSTPSTSSSRRGSREAASLDTDRRESQGSIVSGGSVRRDAPRPPTSAPSLLVTAHRESPEGQQDSDTRADTAGSAGLDQAKASEPWGRSNHVSWTWEGIQNAGHRLRRMSDQPLSPTTKPQGPYFPIPPAVKVNAPRSVSFSNDQSEAPRSPSSSSLSPPAASLLHHARNSFRRSSSQTTNTSSLRASVSSRRVSETPLAPIPDDEGTSQAPKPPVMTQGSSTFGDGGVPSSSTTSREVAEMRSRIRMQLRLLFLYPLLYIAMWFVPFMSHLLGRDDANQRSNPLWLAGLSMASLSVQGAVNAALFAGREKPWRHRDPRGFWGGLRDRLDTAASDYGRWYGLLHWAEGGRRKSVGSGRSRQQMLEDGRHARSRREQEVAIEKGQAVGNKAGDVGVARVPTIKFWWDLEFERADAIPTPEEWEI